MEEKYLTSTLDNTKHIHTQFISMISKLIDDLFCIVRK